MHIFNVSITNVQGLKNVSLKVCEELITQCRYPIKDARPPAIHHSISRMHFVQSGQKSFYCFRPLLITYLFVGLYFLSTFIIYDNRYEFN
jgi:hypothetical protein